MDNSKGQGADLPKTPQARHRMPVTLEPNATVEGCMRKSLIVDLFGVPDGI